MPDAMDPIPFNRAPIGPDELAAATAILSTGRIAGNGRAGEAAEVALSAIHGGARTLLTTSCSHALELSALLLELRPGDEVIVPAFTFVTSASSFLLHGGTPRLVDVRADTLNLDIDAVEAAIGPRTRAIVAVHYGGIGATPDALRALADRHGLALVEDNAHGLGGAWRGQRLGTFGAMSTLSFHETKNVSCGEGGALVLNDPELVARAEVLREKGTDRSRFLRGQVDKYTWVDIGSSWVLSDLLAAILGAQLERLEAIQADRMRVWQRYDAELATWADAHGIRRPHIPVEAEHTAHVYHLRLPSLAARTRFIDHLAAEGITAVFHYQSLDRSVVGRGLVGEGETFPVSEEAGDTLVRLPLFSTMAAAEQDRIIERVLAFDGS
ncbi:MAG: hypothetical protein RLZZ272_1393 [Actinomycetota bacterium]